MLATKLSVPAAPPQVVPRVRLLDRLDAGLAPHSRLTLVSAPAGFGKTTLVGEWVARIGATETDRDVVCLLADGGWKYLSTDAWNQDLIAAEKGVEESLWW